MYDPKDAGQLHKRGDGAWSLNRGSNYHITVSGLSEPETQRLRDLLASAYTDGYQINEDEWRPIIDTPTFQFHELQEWFDRALPLYRERLQPALDAADTDREQHQAKIKAAESLHVWPSDPLDMQLALDAGEMPARFVWRVLESTFLASAHGRHRYLQQKDDDLHTESSLITAWRLRVDDASCPACQEAAGLYSLDDPPKLPLHVGGCSNTVEAEYDVDLDAE